MLNKLIQLSNLSHPSRTNLRVQKVSPGKLKSYEFMSPSSSSGKVKNKDSTPFTHGKQLSLRANAFWPIVKKGGGGVRRFLTFSLVLMLR